jgi:hypothetical protein
MARLRFVAGLMLITALSSCSKRADNEGVLAGTSNARPAAVSSVVEAAAADIPSDDEVRAAAIAFMNEIDDDQVPYLKSEMPSRQQCLSIFDSPDWVAEGAECHNSLNSLDQLDVQKGESLEAFKNEIAPLNLQACTVALDSVSYAGEAASDCRGTVKEFADYKSKIADMKYNSIDSVFNVVSIGNYEGTIISYVDIRKKGSDDWAHGKLRIKRVNNTWVADGGSDAFEK